MENEVPSEKVKVDGKFPEHDSGGIPVYFKHNGEIFCIDCAEEHQPETVEVNTAWYYLHRCDKCGTEIHSYYGKPPYE